MKKETKMENEGMESKADKMKEMKSGAPEWKGKSSKGKGKMGGKMNYKGKMC